DDAVRGRAPALEREVEPRQRQLEADHVGRQDAQGLLEQLLPGVVALEDDHGPRVHAAAILLWGFGRATCGYEGRMARRGWTRRGRKGRGRYFDAAGKRVTDPEKVERVEALVIPPAWKDVWIAPGPRAKLQATGVDAAGRRQYLYHPTFRAAQEQAKYDRLIGFAEALPDLRASMSKHMELDTLERDRVCAIAVRLI